jgi:hypothetical protein
MELIPVTLLTGFRGSSKPTLLTELLQKREFANTTAVVNECRDVGLDGVLIEHSKDQIVTDAFFTKFIHNHSVAATMLLRKYAVQKRGFSRTKKSGQDGN